ncbi:MAG: TonB-dependent receptor [Bacteroidota bacterium]
MGLGLLLSTGLFAQRQITGTVSNTSGEALVGATVVVKGSTQGTLTDNAGGFRISAGEGSTLLFSFIGYESQEVAVGSSNVINVTLKVDDVTLTEVVVTGYTTQRKEDLTGSVSVVKPKELMEVPTGNVANQLQGRVAGMTVSQDGRPGSPTKVRIRGIGSFGNNDPLYVVDGVPTQDINTLNPNDIESISVLKDAGAASIYGSRASNGVVVITTKRGSEGVNVGYSMFTGVQDPGPGPQNLLSAQGYADLQWLVYANDGTDEIHPVYGPSPAAGGSNPTLPSWAANTNWWDELTDPALITNHDITLSGGTKNAKFYAGVNYFRQDGVVIETYTQRLSARFNSEFNIKDRVTIGENFVLTHNLNGRGVGNNAESAPIMDVYRNQSIIPSRITTPIEGIARTFVPGEYGGGGLAPRLGNGSNPVASAERDADDYGFNIRLVGSAFADVKILEGLNFRTTFGGTYGMNYFVNYNFATYERAENVATPSFTEGAGFGGDWVWTNTITFDRDFGANSILAVAGYEAVKYGIGRGVSGQRAGYFSDAVSFRTLNNGANIVAANSGFGTPTTLVSNFLRVDYGYDSKYLLSATVRRDGSSRFGSNNRFGIFPSVTAAWRVGQEDFLIGNGFISDLKIRGGYGTMGNQLSVAPDNQFFLFGGSPNTSNYDLNGTGTSSLQGFRPTRIGNADAKWETNVTTNIGFDAAFLDNKLEFVFDYYIKSNVDLLFNQELPGIAGAASAPSVNIAEMRNDGIDMQLIYRQQSGDFGFEGNLTFTTYRNEIVSLADSVEFFDFGGSRIGSFNRNQVGMPISSFFGFQVDGIFQNQGEVDGAATQEGAEPGFLRFADIDGDGEITPEDRTFIGNPNPDFTAGLNLNFTYKNWDMSTFLYASYGAEIFNFTRWWVDYWPSFQGQKSTDLLNNSWTLDRPDATVPKASNKSNFSTNTQSTSYYIEDGSYLRMRNLQIGYTFQPQPGSALGSMRVYLQGSNLFTLTPYSGVDPELNTRDDREIGVDEGTYPVVRQFLIGLSLGF